MSDTAAVMAGIEAMLAPSPPELTPVMLREIREWIGLTWSVPSHYAEALLGELNRASAELAEALARIGVLEDELAPWRAVQQLRDAQLDHRTRQADQ